MLARRQLSLITAPISRASATSRRSSEGERTPGTQPQCKLGIVKTDSVRGHRASAATNGVLQRARLACVRSAGCAKNHYVRFLHNTVNNSATNALEGCRHRCAQQRRLPSQTTAFRVLLLEKRCARGLRAGCTGSHLRGTLSLKQRADQSFGRHRAACAVASGPLAFMLRRCRAARVPLMHLPVHPAISGWVSATPCRLG